MVEKADAKKFFIRLENYLNTNLPDTSSVNEEIAAGKDEYRRTHKGSALDFEARFFKRHVVPRVHKFLIQDGLDSATAKQSLLAEGYLGLTDYASGTPASKKIYPYKKTLAATLKNAREKWWGEEEEVLSESCPDLALRLPSGLNIVFEGKVFRTGGAEAAKSAIVAGIHECFFYRALPTLMNCKGPTPGSYEYACFLAYDASRDHAFLRVWQDINPKVSHSCWEGLNIDVMIVRARRPNHPKRSADEPDANHLL